MGFSTRKHDRALGRHWARRCFLDALKARVLRIAGILFLTPVLSACQLGYIVKSAYHQADLLRRRVPVEEVLQDPNVNPEIRRKLLLTQQVRAFAESDLGLRHTDNYTTFVQLNRPYVTYAVSAAPRYELEHYMWTFPIVGKVPYLGFFDEASAKKEAQKMKDQGMDAMVRGVSAYSTLGWFKDPILSSMLDYQDYDLVNVIIHETVHATIYIKSSADFNEQLATFVGNIGSEIFYLQKEGEHSPTLERIKLENDDDRKFSKFIAAQMDELRQWYSEHKNHPNETERQLRLKQIQANYSELKAQLATHKYDNFASGGLNNARLLLYQTYFQDLGDFEHAYESLGRDFRKLIAFCKKLQKSKDPIVQLRSLK